MEYSIPTERLSKLEQFVKRLEKKGSPVKFEVLGTELRKDSKGFSHECTIVDVEGNYKVSGWDFVATLEHTPGGNIIRSISDDYKIPEKYLNCGPACEHCGKLRTRTDTYLVFNSNNREFKQVGRSCLKDYTGLDAATCALNASFIQEVEDSTDLNSDWKGITSSDLISKELFNKICILEVMKNGYNREQTVDSISNMLRDLKDAEDKVHGNEAVDSLYSKIDARVEPRQDDSSYEHNAKLAWKLDAKSYKHIALVASYVSSVLKQIEREELRAKELADSDFKFVGDVGSKVIIKVASSRVLYTKAPYTYYGDTSYVHRIVGEDGNIYVWSTTKEEIPVGSEISATIKAHSEYRGEKQNVITRGKLLEQVELTQSETNTVSDALDAFYDSIK